MTTKQSIGKIAITPKGVWSNSIAYYKFDLINYGASSYLAVQDSYNKNPLSFTSYW